MLRKKIAAEYVYIFRIEKKVWRRFFNLIQNAFHSLSTKLGQGLIKTEAAYAFFWKLTAVDSHTKQETELV